jgi:hypothetical protein
MRLTDVFAKCTSLFISWCHSELHSNNPVTAEWFLIWLRFFMVVNPPDLRLSPRLRVSYAPN